MGKIRIIGGKFRSRVLQFADDVPDLRPTPNRVRETLFNWLGQDLSGTVCLDLFAGSGALSFEALSRGAKFVVAVEQNSTAIKHLVCNKHRLALDDQQMNVIMQDAIYYLTIQPATQQFDIIFLDAPYQSELLTQSLQLISSSSLLTPSGMVYIEYSKQPNWAAYTVIKQSKAGDVRYALLTLI